MRLLLSAAVVLALAGPAAAQPKAAGLTPQEVADGWLMLFDGETAFGWKVDGAAEVKDGTLILGKGKKTVAYPTSRFGSNFEYELQAAGSATVISMKDRVEFASDPVTGWRTVTYRRTNAGIGMGSGGPGSSRGFAQESRDRKSVV